MNKSKQFKIGFSTLGWDQAAALDLTSPGLLGDGPGQASPLRPTARAEGNWAFQWAGEKGPHSDPLPPKPPWLAFHWATRADWLSRGHLASRASHLWRCQGLRSSVKPGRRSSPRLNLTCPHHRTLGLEEVVEVLQPIPLPSAGTLRSTQTNGGSIFSWKLFWVQ